MHPNFVHAFLRLLAVAALFVFLLGVVSGAVHAQETPVADSHVLYAVEQLGVTTTAMATEVAALRTAVDDLRGSQNGVVDGWRLSEAREGLYAVSRGLGAVAVLLVVVVALQVASLVMRVRG